MKLISFALLALATVAPAAASASALDALLAETSPKDEAAKSSPANPVEVAPATPVAESPIAEPAPVAPVEALRTEPPQVESPASQAESEMTNEVSQVEEPLPKKEKKKLTGRPAKITSDSTIYNRKEGIASFEGHVHVDDEQYQMHADRVFLFFDPEDRDKDKKSDKTKNPEKAGGTNEVKRVNGGTGELRRVVAIGHVAMTNETKRAYGAKATYSKKNGLVVLHSGDGIMAEVRDESKGEEKIVRGKRIRFWIGAEQVEVDEADLTGTAPAGGADSLKKALGK